LKSIELGKSSVKISGCVSKELVYKKYRLLYKRKKKVYRLKCYNVRVCKYRIDRKPKAGKGKSEEKRPFLVNFKK
jgi:hypothetical protein